MNDLLTRWHAVAPGEVFALPDFDLSGNNLGPSGWFKLRGFDPENNALGHDEPLVGPDRATGRWDHERKASLLWHVLACARRRGLRVMLDHQESPPPDEEEAVTFVSILTDATPVGSPYGRSTEWGEADSPCPTMAAVEAYVVALEKAARLASGL